MLLGALRRIALFASVILIAPHAAAADFCGGKASGYWCDGSTLVFCSGGSVASTKACPAGCTSMPPGVNDECAGGGGFCSGKASGYWCDGDDLVLCSGGQVASSSHCDAGCQQNPQGVDDACKSAPTGFCSGKANGAWCDGDDLVQCSGGQVASSSHCDAGCQQNPQGVADECKSSEPQGFCSGKANGAWCDGDDLVQCSGGQVASSSHCSDGCQQNPAGVADACKSAEPQGFCSGKADGAWCDGDDLVHCAAGQVASTSHCPDGCQQNPAGVADACKPAQPQGFCSGKADGAWCDGNALVTCAAGAVTSTVACTNGCQQNPQGQSDACNAATSQGFCAGRADGLWCDGATLVLCGGGSATASKPCTNGCQQNPAGQDDGCKDPAPADFCAGRADGRSCNADVLVTCQGGATAGTEPCPSGCLESAPGVDDSCASTGGKPTEPGAAGNVVVTDSGGCASFSGEVRLKVAPLSQLDHTEQLGSCPGLTIASDGCTVTSLTMLYSYLQMPRTADGATGNTPVIENAWRKAHSGYGSCGSGVGSCCVVWAKNPAGLALQYNHNPSSSCVSTAAGNAIAQSLNAGLPVVAGVHWSGTIENQHWVLVVGADDQGLLINDPWGGGSNLRLESGALGSYVVDVFYAPVLSPGVGGVVDAQGNAVDEAELPDGLNGFVTPPEGWRTEGFSGGEWVPPTAVETSIGEDTGCTAARGGGGTLLIVLAAMLLAVRRRTSKYAF